MKILFAPDSFKGSISSSRAIELLCDVTRRHFPGCEMLGVPIGDGGEGTTEALMKVLGGREEHVNVSDPLGRKLDARYAVVNGGRAVIEMAQASGLPLLSPEEREPLKTSSYGTGELLCHALDHGCKEIILMLGGSATNDGGLGAAAALGIRFLDQEGRDVSHNGYGLERVASADTSGMHPGLKQARITIMCDVTNPLLGANGATYVYGAQKGADAAAQDRLESGMANYAAVVERASGRVVRDIPGVGAAGGLAVPLIAFAEVKLQSGIETVLNLLDFDKLLEGVDLVITGEGRLDFQSAQGKALCGIGRACQKRGIPVCAVAGCFGDGAEDIYNCGVQGIVSCTNRLTAEGEALRNAEERFIQAADRMYRMIKIGMGLNRQMQHSSVLNREELQA